MVPAYPRNDPRQYDDLALEWWKPRGAFCALHWLARARAELIPPAGKGAVLVDVACGGGVMAPIAAAKGYRHVGVDLGVLGLRLAREHGVEVVRGDALRLPLRSRSADVVVAGEILEHVHEPERLVAEAARVLRPGGTFVCDSISDSRLSKFVMITVAERAGIAPAGIHDPALLVAPSRITRACAAAGIDLRVRGLRPAAGELLAWLAHRRDDVTLKHTRFTGVVWQGSGVRVRRAA